MRFFDGETINLLLTFPLFVDAMESAHRGAPILVADTMLGDLAASYFVRNTLDPGRYVGSKLITSTPANLDRGDLPAVQAVFVIFDAAHGRPIAAMDGTVLTQWRTAADSALGARLLARPDVNHLLIVGAGAMALPLAHAHPAVRPTIEYPHLEPHPRPRPTRRRRTDYGRRPCARGNRPRRRRRRRRRHHLDLHQGDRATHQRPPSATRHARRPRRQLHAIHP